MSNPGDARLPDYSKMTLPVPRFIVSGAPYFRKG